MTSRELLVLCTSWDESAEAFAKIVGACVSVFGMSQREMADEFEVAESTVSRWSNGVARPHAKIRKLVVASIRRRAQKMVARSTGSSVSTYPAAAKGR